MAFNAVADNKSIFICFAVVASQICKILWNSPEIRAYSSSRLSVLVPIKSTYATSYLSLIVTLTISPTVFMILTFKARKWPVFPVATPPLFDAPTQGNPLEFLDETYPTKLDGWIKFHNPNFYHFWLLHLYDRQTNRRAIAYITLSIHAICCRVLMTCSFRP